MPPKKSIKAKKGSSEHADSELAPPSNSVQTKAKKASSEQADSEMAPSKSGKAKKGSSEHTESEAAPSKSGKSKKKALSEQKDSEMAPSKSVEAEKGSTEHKDSGTAPSKSGKSKKATSEHKDSNIVPSKSGKAKKKASSEQKDAEMVPSKSVEAKKGSLEHTDPEIATSKSVQAEKGSSEHTDSATKGLSEEADSGMAPSKSVPAKKASSERIDSEVAPSKSGKAKKGSLEHTDPKIAPSKSGKAKKGSEHTESEIAPNKSVEAKKGLEHTESEIAPNKSVEAKKGSEHIDSEIATSKSLEANNGSEHADSETAPSKSSVKAKRDELYAKCAEEAPDYVFNQEYLVGLKIAKDLHELLEICQDLVSSNLFQVITVDGQLCYKIRSEHGAQRLTQLSEKEHLVYTLIESASNFGIWTKTLKAQTNLHLTLINRCLKTLESMRYVKQIKSVRWPGRKIYMLYELVPSEETTGGPWYSGGELDVEFVEQILSIVELHIKRVTWREVTWSAPTSDGKQTTSHGVGAGGEQPEPPPAGKKEPKHGTHAHKRPHPLTTYLAASPCDPTSFGPAIASVKHSTARQLLPHPPGYEEYPSATDILDWLDINGVIKDKQLDLASVQSLLDVLEFDGRIERMGSKPKDPDEDDATEDESGESDDAEGEDENELQHQDADGGGEEEPAGAHNPSLKRKRGPATSIEDDDRGEPSTSSVKRKRVVPPPTQGNQDAESGSEEDPVGVPKPSLKRKRNQTTVIEDDDRGEPNTSSVKRKRVATPPARTIKHIKKTTPRPKRRVMFSPTAIASDTDTDVDSYMTDPGEDSESTDDSGADSDTSQPHPSDFSLEEPTYRWARRPESTWGNLDPLSPPKKHHTRTEANIKTENDTSADTNKTDGTTTTTAATATATATDETTAPTTTKQRKTNETDQALSIGPGNGRTQTPCSTCSAFRLCEPLPLASAPKVEESMGGSGGAYAGVPRALFGKPGRSSRPVDARNCAYLGPWLEV